MIQEPPEDVQIKPKIPSYRAVGSISGQRLLLTLQSRRVDWLITSPEGMVDMDNGTWASIGQFPEALDELMVPISRRWWELGFEFRRIALGCDVFVPLPDPEAGFAILRDRFDVPVEDSPGASDFV